MSSIAPYIPLFGDAYLSDTRHLTLEEHGAYLLLMMIAWRSEGCCLPDDDHRLAKMIGVSKSKWAKLKPAVLGFWALDNGVWIQKRLTKERKFVEQKRSKNKASANARWNSQVIENIEHDGCERICERNAPSPSPSHTPKEREILSNDNIPLSRFAFEGSVIKLSKADFAKWEKAFPAIDLKAVLQSRDDWLATEADDATRKKWFLSTSNWLAKKQGEKKVIPRTSAWQPGDALC